MNEPVAIHKLSAQEGLTSRTLRHWEAEGLFKSLRDVDSGWRTYDNDAILCIQITALLRKLDVPIKEIKAVIDNKTYGKMHKVIANRISLLKAQRAENQLAEKKLKEILYCLKEQSDQFITDKNFQQIAEIITSSKTLISEMEDFSMSDLIENSPKIRFISLPSMRAVYNIAVSVSPEDEAMIPVIDWIKSTNLAGTARLFGGNMPPMPSGDGKPYGYGMCVTIPDGVPIPDHLKEMILPGGLYAMFESSDDIGNSWKTLMRNLSKSEKYISDSSRLCFEEHIRNDRPESSGREYSLNLLQPVKVK